MPSKTKDRHKLAKWEAAKAAALPGDPRFRWNVWAEYHLPEGLQRNVFLAIKDHTRTSVRNGQAGNAKIDFLYKKFWPDDPHPPQRRQQRLGAVISRINAQLRPLGFVIKPGTEKRTYLFRRLRLGE